MKLHPLAALPVAAALLFLPTLSHAQAGVIASETPGVVVLPHSLDQHKLAAGALIETDLTQAVHLGSVELPKGTHLIATVADDDMQLNGHDKLALRFTEARLKGGKTIPIKATIVAVGTQPMAVENDTTNIEVIMPTPKNLNDQPDDIQEEGVTAGVDLHSRANSTNSGVFVTDKDNIKLPQGSKMELALVAQ